MCCACGCGQQVWIANRNRPAWGWVKGQPVKYRRGHKNRGPTHPWWKGGKYTDRNGYITVASSLNGGKQQAEHIIVAEQALGHALPEGAIIHHVNENPADNRPQNLVICQDRAYHILLHLRLKALRACGNPNWRQCTICQQWDDPSNMTRHGRPNGNSSYRHRACHTQYEKQRRERQRKESL